MKRLLLPFLILLLGNCTSQTDKSYYLLTGTYTNEGSKGIYVYQFNPKDGSLKEVSVATGVQNPSYLAISPDQRWVYAVEEIHGNGGGGKVTAFSFDQKTGNLTRLNQQPSGGDDPCYVSVDHTGKWLVVGNYSSGSLSVYPIQSDGNIGNPSDSRKHEGSGPNKERQEGPHVHSTVISPDNRFLMVPDLGLDKVMIYQFNSETGKLSTGEQAYAETDPGSGPRHFDFHPNGKWAYLMEEMGGKVVVFDYNARNGTLQPIQTISSLPEDYHGSMGSADIHVSPDGRFVYASNRGESNTIAVFSVDGQTGKLTLIQLISTGGLIPRNFSIDPGGTYLLVANQNSNDIVIFRRDVQTGKLSETGKKISVSKPVCLKWIVP